MSRLDMVVGPNGAGKSTFVEFVLTRERPGVTLVNADVMAEQRWLDDPMSHAHEAAEAAERTGDELLGRGEPFIAEPVASHTSKIDLVRRAKEACWHVHILAAFVDGDIVGPPRWPSWVSDPLTRRWPVDT